MKFLLLILAFLLTSCYGQPVSKYSGKIVEKRYNVFNELDTTIIVMTDKGSVNMWSSPYFKELNIGEEISVICDNAFFHSNCYFDSRIKK